MLISVHFQFNHEKLPIAVTGIQGDVSCMLVPTVGDLVRHRDAAGNAFEGKVTERVFLYQLPNGEAVDGSLTVTLCLDRTVLQ